MSQPTEDLRYPIGKFRPAATVTAEQREEWIQTIESLPAALRRAVNNIPEGDLARERYRPGGWTIRQLLHHLADSHLNSYIRFKLGLTEDEPTVKPYDEAAWAELPDSRELPAELSLQLIDLLHQRWAFLLRQMSEADFARTVLHPEHGRIMRLDFLLDLYAWHSRHHLQHLLNWRDQR
jgi:hypothetical protein